MSFLRNDQRDALVTVAHKFGWDQMTIQSLGLLMWCAFHYYVMRLGDSGNSLFKERKAAGFPGSEPIA